MRPTIALMDVREKKLALARRAKRLDEFELLLEDVHPQDLRFLRSMISVRLEEVRLFRQHGIVGLLCRIAAIDAELERRERRARQPLAILKPPDNYSMK